MALLSPGIQVTVTDESIYLPAAATTVPLFFIATKYGKKIGNTNQIAQGTIEAGVPRLITSLRDSLDLYGIPVFYRDVYNQPHHGDCRNEYGLLALNQFLKVGNRAYVIRADIDLDDSVESLESLWTDPTNGVITKISTKAKLLLNAAIIDRSSARPVSAARATLFGGAITPPADVVDANGIILALPAAKPAAGATGNDGLWVTPYVAGSEYTDINNATHADPYDAWSAYYDDLGVVNAENVKLDLIIDTAIQELFTTTTSFSDKYTNSAYKKFNISSILSGNFFNVESRTLDINGINKTTYSPWVDVTAGSTTSTSSTDERVVNLLSKNARTVLDNTGVAAVPEVIMYGLKGELRRKMLPSTVAGVTTPGSLNSGVSISTFNNLVADVVTSYQKTNSWKYATQPAALSGSTTFSQLLLGNGPNQDALRRVEVVRALSQVISDNNSVNLDVDTLFDTSDITSEGYEFNLILCPGYPECVDELLVLSNRVKQEAFVIADTPMDLSPRDVIRWGQMSDEGAGVVTAGNIRADNSGINAYYYPHGLIQNLDGADVLCPASALALAAMTNSDNKSNVWFAPAGPTRGLVSSLIGVNAVGYVSGTLGTANVEFKRVRLSDGMRDSLYNLCNINPIHDSIQYGVAVWGQKTRVNTSFNSALDRINVSRMVMYVRRGIRKALSRFLMEQNDDVTRKNITSLVTSYLYDIQIKRGLYDFAVLCDSSNNTGTTIDRNELYVSIALKPTKAIEFIYVPITLVNTSDPMTL